MDIPYPAKSFEISEMIGKTFSKVTNIDNDILEFRLENGDRYVFHHFQDCCEHVSIEDIVGDLSNLEGSPILEAEEVGGEIEDTLDGYGTQTWTFYKFSTIKGHVNVRWFGSSNGYYSEAVDKSFIEAGEND